MPIPALTPHGFLPIGIFDCTLPEIRAGFGAFQDSDQRPRLFVRLEELVAAMRSSGLFRCLLVDGSL